MERIFNTQLRKYIAYNYRIAVLVASVNFDKTHCLKLKKNPYLNVKFLLNCFKKEFFLLTILSYFYNTILLYHCAISVVLIWVLLVFKNTNLNDDLNFNQTGTRAIK